MKDLIKKRKPEIDIKSREQVVPVALEITKEYQDKLDDLIVPRFF